MPAVRLEHPMRERQTEENKREANVGNEHQKQNPVPLMYWTLLGDCTPEIVNFKCLLWQWKKHTERQTVSKNSGGSRERETGRPGMHQSLCFTANHAEFSQCLFVHPSSPEGVQKEKRKSLLWHSGRSWIASRKKSSTAYSHLDTCMFGRLDSYQKLKKTNLNATKKH